MRGKIKSNLISTTCLLANCIEKLTNVPSLYKIGNVYDPQSISNLDQSDYDILSIKSISHELKN